MSVVHIEFRKNFNIPFEVTSIIEDLLINDLQDIKSKHKLMMEDTFYYISIKKSHIYRFYKNLYSFELSFPNKWGGLK